MQSLDELPEILTAQDIAKYLRISRGSVYELFKIRPEQGGIPNIAIGLSRRVEKKDFLNWIEAKKQEKASKISPKQTEEVCSGYVRRFGKNKGKKVM